MTVEPSLVLLLNKDRPFLTNTEFSRRMFAPSTPRDKFVKMEIAVIFKFTTYGSSILFVLFSLKKFS